MRKWIVSSCFVFILFNIGQVSAQSIHVSANNAVLIEQSSGRILFQKNAHDRQFVASITKIMTAIIAIEYGNFDDMVQVSNNAVLTDGSSIYLEKNEHISLKDLLYGLMLRSGNDAAVAISEHIAGSEEGFVFLMNEKAKWLGMTNTHFENSHGLESDDHYSTAYDIALLLRYAANNELFRKISGTSSYLSDNRTYKWHNKNKLLTNYYKYCTGGKTGFTKRAGRTLATTAKKNDMELIAVTLNAPDDWKDHIRMFEWGYEQYDLKQIQTKGLENFFLPDQDHLKDGYINRDVFYPIQNHEEKNIEERNFLLSSEKYNKQIGKKVFYLQSQPIITAPIYSPYMRTYDEWIEGIKNMIGLKTNG